ncbi:uncharacterized protein [Mycetomoellerius zeteki]|uniref:uncharacterized protein n=1 Tax=Mycetomoellerius zeteki TaxID=64791 RepID=UPI00084EA0D4|nr:PREDICTED: uncharacterized protein LOC108727399 [Trachymyrmex zeteki]
MRNVHISSSVYSPISYYGDKFTMQSVVLHYYHINKTFMSQIGTWPYQSKTKRILILSTIVLVDVSILIAEVTMCRSLFAVYIYTSMALFMMIPMSPQIMDIVMPLNDSRPRKLLIEVEYRVDREKYYYPILFHSYVAIILCISIVVCVDTTYISYVEHGCGLFAAIGYRLEHIISKGHIDKTSYFAKSKERTYQDVEVEDTCFKEKAIFYEFVTCLQKHQLAIQYVRVLESSFTLSTGIQLLCNVVGISLIGIQVINNLDNTENIIRYTALWLASFFHLLCMTLPGQRLMDHSLNVFNSVSIVPCTLTAGKLYVMSMVNYSSVIQTAMSYFTTFSSLK